MKYTLPNSTRVRPYSILAASVGCRLLILSLVILAGLPPYSVSAEPKYAEIIDKTRKLAAIVSDADEVVSVGSPVAVRSTCNLARQFIEGRCSRDEILVPFDITGPGSAYWSYVALFREISPDTKAETELRQYLKHRIARYALLEFKFISFDYGRLQWETAKPNDGAIVVDTLHWTRSDPHSRPSARGTVKLTLGSSISIVNVEQR